MRSALVLILLFLSLPALAATARISSGEHDDFSRLVLELPTPSDWRLGRTPDGYELSLSSPEINYDLTEVFRLIPKTRLAAIWKDPSTGNLQFKVVCACHALPFELRPGIVVIDVRDGPPQVGVSFEASLSGSPFPPLAGAQRTPIPRGGKHAPAGLNWRAAVLDAAKFSPTDDDNPEESGEENSALRESLIFELAAGASKGVIELSAPIPRSPVGLVRSPQNIRISVGDQPGINLGEHRVKPGSLTAKGRDCISDSEIDLTNWVEDTPISEQFAHARSGLYGEFDHLEKDKLMNLIKFYLAIGFGAEASQLIDLKNDNAARATLDRHDKVLQAIASVLDGKADPHSVLREMATCDGSVALWATLAIQDFTPDDRVNSAAVRRSFSALPIPLRLQLGPELVQRFLARKEDETVKVLQAAMLRASGPDADVVRLTAAKAALSQGETNLAEAELSTLSGSSGEIASDVLLQQTVARLDLGLPVSESTVVALEALTLEQQGTKREGELIRVLVLARAAAGKFKEAFASLDAAPTARDSLWEMLADQGTDDDLLFWAVPDSPPPALPAPVSIKLAHRLIKLGLAEQALDWLGDPPKDELMAARAHFLGGDAQATLRLLAGKSGIEQEELRISALERLGDDAAAAELRLQLKDVEGASRSRSWSSDWREVGISGQEPWRQIAQSVAAPPVDVIGARPLAASSDVLRQSTMTRAAISELLAAAPPGIR